MLPIIKSCIRARLMTEKLNKLEPMGKFDIYLISILILTSFVAGVVILSYFISDELRCLGKIEVGVIAVVVSLFMCFYLDQSHYYEKTKVYIDTLDEESFKKVRRHDIKVVWGAISVYMITLIVVVVKFFMDV